ncbi:ImmA/IrrE family metallo-endopeptidase [Macrococcoides bohemicum]|uniref:ImmA/IrrE family metallo-endopeptidase n=1 Tax=Macrococcoides bohemicum TaxID=1903056 RepID=UPI00165E753C|nr:ImmA/IrrE family metallo-endopeptidase [Macrococcus bohemicus]MBC9873660.1 ImmA/IrrE family metallo-endopeptidase [Macrococcus bohemicus]
MWIKEIYSERGITTPDDLNIDNVASAFNISLFKNWDVDVHVKSNDIDIIMLRANDLHTMNEVFFHEFAHVLRHGHTHINDSYRQYCEGQANTLMYELAVPSFMITDPCIDYKYIQHKFNVSEKFALKRIEQLKNEIINKGA